MSKVKGLERFAQKADNYMHDKEIRKLMLKYDVSGKILEVMEEKDITKTELAEILKTSVSNMSQILNGYRNLTLDTICEISMALDTTVEICFNEMKKEDRSDSFEMIDFYVGSAETYADRAPIQGLVGLCLR